MTLDSIYAIVLHFRTVDDTRACLESLLESGLSKAVLVDNSEDGGRSLASLRSYLADLADLGLTVAVIEPGRNLGFAAGVNMGSAHALEQGASGILLLNSDAHLTHDALRMMVGELEQQVGVVVPRIQSALGAGGEFHYHVWTGLLLRSPGRGTVRLLSGACLLIHREIAIKFPLDELFFFYGEDVEWSGRLSRAGVPIKLSGAVVVHEGAKSARNGSMFYEYHMVRGHWLLSGRLLNGAFQVAAAGCLRALTLSLRAVVRSIRARSVVPLRAFLAATLDVVKGRKVSLTPPA